MPKKSFVINPKKKKEEREKNKESRVHAQLARCATSRVLSTIIPAWIIQQSVAPLLPKALITGVLNHIIIILESKLIRKLSWFAHLKSNLLWWMTVIKLRLPFTYCVLYDYISLIERRIADWILFKMDFFIRDWLFMALSTISRVRSYNSFSSELLKQNNNSFII